MEFIVMNYILTSICTGLAIFFANFFLDRRKIMKEKLYILQSIFYIYNIVNYDRETNRYIKNHFNEIFMEQKGFEKFIKPRYSQFFEKEELCTIKEICVNNKGIFLTVCENKNKNSLYKEFLQINNDQLFNENLEEGKFFKYKSFFSFLRYFDKIMLFKLIFYFPIVFMVSRFNLPKYKIKSRLLKI